MILYRMMRQAQRTEPVEKNVTAGYVIPPAYKRRIEEMAKAQDLSESQIVRRIFSEYFARVDVEAAIAARENGSVEQAK